MLCSANQRVHKDEKVVRAVMPFLMVKKKIHESFFKRDTGMLPAPFHYISSFPLPKAPSAFEKRISGISGIVVHPLSREQKKALGFTTPPGSYCITWKEKSTANFAGKQRIAFRLFSQGPLKKRHLSGSGADITGVFLPLLGRKGRVYKDLWLLKKGERRHVQAVASALFHTGFDHLAIFEDHEEVTCVPERKVRVAETVLIPVEGVDRPFFVESFGAMALAHNGFDFSGSHAALNPLQIVESRGARGQQENQRNQNEFFGQAHSRMEPSCMNYHRRALVARQIPET
jgi:hypothetical protein